MDAPLNRRMTQGWTRLDAETCGHFHQTHDHGSPDGVSPTDHLEGWAHRDRINWCPVNNTQVRECGLSRPPELCPWPQTKAKAKARPSPKPNPRQVRECGCVYEALSGPYQTDYGVGDEASKP